VSTLYEVRQKKSIEMTYIGLRKEVKAYSDQDYIKIKDINSGSYRLLSRKTAILVYLLKGTRSYEDVYRDYNYLTDCSREQFELIVSEIKHYIHTSVVKFDAGYNYLNIDNVLVCRSPEDVLELKQPLNIFLRAVNICDKNCRYCSEMARMNSKMRCDFSIQLISNIFLNLDKNKIFFEITGGEPLIHPEINDIMAELEKLHIPVSLITKATSDYLLFQELVNKYSISRVCFSLDSYKKDYVDYITRRSGTFDNIVECMRIAKNAGTSIDVNAVITKINICDIEKMVMFCIENQVSNLHFTTVWSVPNCDSSLILNENDKKRVYILINQLRKKYIQYINIEITTSKCEGEDRCDKCGKALTDVKIDIDGDVTLCNGIVIGNINRACLYDIWNSSSAKNIRKNLMKQMATHNR
jgi:MoaA/NifB/PqqE/SkfB family radical SAM enzyme